MNDSTTPASICDIDLTAGNAGLIAVCEQAVELSIAGVCVAPTDVSAAFECIRKIVEDRGAEHTPRLITTLEAPVTENPTSDQLDALHQRALHAIEDGAAEIDLTIDVALLTGGHRAAVRAVIEAAAYAAHGAKPAATLTVALKPTELTEEARILACRATVEGEADFLKAIFSSEERIEEVSKTLSDLHRRLAPVRLVAALPLSDLESGRAMLDSGATRLCDLAHPPLLFRLTD